MPASEADPNAKVINLSALPPIDMLRLQAALSGCSAGRQGKCVAVSRPQEPPGGALTTRRHLSRPQ